MSEETACPLWTVQYTPKKTAASTLRCSPAHEYNFFFFNHSTMEAQPKSQMTERFITLNQLCSEPATYFTLSHQLNLIMPKLIIITFSDDSYKILNLPSSSWLIESSDCSGLNVNFAKLFTLHLMSYRGSPLCFVCSIFSRAGVDDMSQAPAGPPSLNDIGPHLGSSVIEVVIK